MTIDNLNLGISLTNTIANLQEVLRDLNKDRTLYIAISDGDSNTVECLSRRIGYEYIKEDSPLALKYEKINSDYIESLKKMYQDEMDALSKQFSEL